MIDILWASVVAVFFFGRSTKEIEEKTQLASKTKTIILFFLAIVVAVFYYKTYQVATIYNYVYVEGLRETRNDSTGQLADTISGIRITNRFNSGGTYGREVKEELIKESLNGGGDVYVEIGRHLGKGYSLSSKNEYKHQLIYKSPFENMGIVYNIKTITSKIPSFLPFFFTGQWNYTDKDKDNILQLKWEFYDLNRHPELWEFKGNILDDMGNFKEREIKDSFFSNAYVVDAILTANEDYIDNLSDGYKTFKYGVSMGSNLTNTLGFFTAADISLYVNQVQIVTENNIKSLQLIYDIPIQTTQIDSCIKVGPYGISVDGKYIQKYDGKMSFHFMLPTLANLQLIRSLILTTILTALVSLFCRNLFFLIRKKALQFKNNHIESIDQKGLKQFKALLYKILAIFLIVSLYFTWLVFNDKPLNVPVDWIPYILLLLLALFILFTWYVYKIFNKIVMKK